MWVVFLMADEESFTRPCPFCEMSFRFPERYTLEQAEEWIGLNHLSVHAVEIATLPALAIFPTGGPMCARCRRYDTAGLLPIDPLHRCCFEVECFCPCSRLPAPAKEISQ